MNIKLLNQMVRAVKPLVLYFSLLGMIACTAEELPPPQGVDCGDIITSYELNIRQIVDNACAYSGCHPEYSTYDGMLAVLEDGSFRSRVLSLEDDPILGMPRDDAPQGRPKDLSEEEMNLIECWLSEDFPEN